MSDSSGCRRLGKNEAFDEGAPLAVGGLSAGAVSIASSTRQSVRRRGERCRI